MKKAPVKPTEIGPASWLSQSWWLSHPVPNANLGFVTVQTPIRFSEDPADDISRCTDFNSNTLLIPHRYDQAVRAASRPSEFVARLQSFGAKQNDVDQVLSLVVLSQLKRDPKWGNEVGRSLPFLEIARSLEAAGHDPRVLLVFPDLGRAGDLPDLATMLAARHDLFTTVYPSATAYLLTAANGVESWVRMGATSKREDLRGPAHVAFEFRKEDQGFSDAITRVEGDTRWHLLVSAAAQVTDGSTDVDVSWLLPSTLNLYQTHLDARAVRRKLAATDDVVSPAPAGALL